jgi:uncharacterized protein YndB with AHSA1/START domain
MIIDIAEQIGAISRQVEQQQSEFGEIVTVTLERRYLAEVADVWQAITDPERLRRWFLPITGDLRPDGNFQLQGNAGGDILTCEAPRHLQVTFGSETSIVAGQRRSRRCRQQSRGTGFQCQVDRGVGRRR